MNRPRGQKAFVGHLAPGLDRRAVHPFDSTSEHSCQN